MLATEHWAHGAGSAPGCALSGEDGGIEQDLAGVPQLQRGVS